MSNGTTQEKIAMTLDLCDTERVRQQLDTNLRQVEQLWVQAEQARKLTRSPQQEQTIHQEQKA